MLYNGILERNDSMIYFDNAATTAVTPAVRDAMLPYFTEYFGNPSSIFYSLGAEARKGMEEARATVAEILGCSPREIFFTASGSEADNWAIRGAALKSGKKHIITSAIEHHAVIHTCEFLEKQGWRVTYLPVDADGLVSPADLEAAICDDTALVSIMYANNEIGTIQPIRELCEIAHKKGVLFHTDAVQAVGTVPVNVADLCVDMLSLSAHKFHGPKGIGALYIKKGVRIERLIHGGAQERGMRAGTENTAYIAGLAKALSDATEKMEEKTEYVRKLRDKLTSGVLAAVPHARLNGHAEKRLPGNANFSFRFIEGEGLLLHLALAGFAVSSGSACASASLDPSHVLLAIGLPHEIAHGSLRVSLSADNTEEEVDAFLAALPPIVERLRQMSPLYEEFLKGEN
ncbi:MAG: cysteine desulfurase NifS [Ruminococcaceae bacterium]|nr:cysteine desulfurase NifS [Oscillospiraceae bacterium]